MKMVRVIRRGQKNRMDDKDVSGGELALILLVSFLKSFPLLRFSFHLLFIVYFLRFCRTNAGSLKKKIIS